MKINETSSQVYAATTQDPMNYLIGLLSSDQPPKFGASEAMDGYMATPITYAPFFCMGASTYNGVLTLSVGFHTPGISEEEINSLMDVMMRELKWCQPFINNKYK